MSTKAPWQSLSKVELVMMLDHMRGRIRDGASANKTRSALRQAVAAIEAAEQMKHALREMQLLVNDFMPNIGRISLQNYARMNDAPIEARQAILNYLAAVPERPKDGAHERVSRREAPQDKNNASRGASDSG